MTEKKKDEVSELKEIIGSLQFNLSLLLASAVAYVKKSNQSIEDFGLLCGEIGAKSWAEGLPFEQVVKNVARMMSSFGAKVDSIDIKTNEGTVILKDWPNKEILGLAEVALDDFERFYVFWKPVMEKQNMQISIETDEDSIIMSFKK